MKHTHSTDFGCPHTEMRTHQDLFEREQIGEDLDFHLKKDAPHYSSKETRIAYFNWESENKDRFRELYQLYQY